MKTGKKTKAVDELTTQEREAVTIVFHQYETGLREGTIFTKVSRWLSTVFSTNNWRLIVTQKNVHFWDFVFLLPWRETCWADMR